MDKNLSKINSNVILITVDCLRGDHLSCNGYTKKTTPFLDELAQKGVNFSQAMSTASWTAPSFISILTSTYPLMHDGYVSMTKDRLSIAEVLSSNGYICAGFPFHPFMSPIYKFDRGFDLYKTESKDQKKHLSITIRFLKALTKKIRKKSIFRKTYSLIQDAVLEIIKLYNYLFLDKIIIDIITTKLRAESINNEVIKWLKDNKEKKIFVWLHYLDTHQPYMPPSKYLKSSIGKLDIFKLHFKRSSVMRFDNPNIISKKELESLIDLYDSNIKYVDYSINLFLKQLENIIDLNNTYVIITADHGDEFLEHDCFNHGLKLYEEYIHVPLIISGPNLPSKNIDTPVGLIDLSPTILDLLEIESPPEFVGKSLLNIINSEIPKLNMCFSEEGREYRTENIWIQPGKMKLNLDYKTVCIRGKKWKYIFNEKREDELYNLIEDPGEQNNLIDSEKSVGNELKLMIKEHLRKGQEITNKRKKILQSINKLKDSKTI